MCGLVGMAGALVYADEDAMRRMLLLNMFRGKDSTGLAAIKPSKEVNIAKMASHPIHLFETPKFKSALNGPQSCVFLGHNRAATKGEVNDYNAHPYKFDNIVGAHNGTLIGSSQHDLEKEIGEKFPVDSMAIIAGIACFGIKETMKHLRGSWAITWVDLEEGTLNFLRNKERPLWFAKSKDDKVLYWASAWPTIHAAANGDKGCERDLLYDKDGKRFYMFTEDTHFRFDISKLMKGESQKPVLSKLEGKEPFLDHSNNYGQVSGKATGRMGLSDPFMRQDNNPNSTIPCLSNHKNKGVVSRMMVEVQGTEDMPYSNVVHKDEFEEMASDGCQFCGTPVNWGDRGITIYQRQKLVLCPTHSAHADKDKTRIYVKEMQVS